MIMYIKFQTGIREEKKRERASRKAIWLSIDVSRFVGLQYEEGIGVIDAFVENLSDLFGVVDHFRMAYRFCFVLW
jgi:hypothetical protein